MIEVLGWIANAFYFSGGLAKKTRASILQYNLGNALYIISYISMGLYAGALSMIISFIRGTLALYLSDKHNRIISLPMTILSCFAISLTLNNQIDCLILFAAICVGIAYYFRDSPITFRTLIVLQTAFGLSIPVF